jgi:serine/threonine protein phosphatase PrpC
MPMEIAVGVDAACATSVGGRTENQDRYALAPGLAVVSDGVGGHAGGGRAAELTVRAVQEALAGQDGRAIAVDEATLVEAFRRANDAVRQGRRDDPSVATMGATLALAAVTAADPLAAESWWLVANVGDSPAWLVTPERAVRVTRDHTLAAELVRAGALSADAADRHPGRTGTRGGTRWSARSARRTTSRPTPSP